MIIRELTWQQFVNQPHVRNLHINEQVRQYNFHLDYIANLNFQNKGVSSTGGEAPYIPTQPAEGFLLQEDGDYLLQETGHRILL